jgi:transposase
VPKAYSSDLRVRVIEAVAAGASRREAAERFEVSIASAVKWLQRWRDDNSVAPKPSGGSVSPLEEFAAEILAVVAEHPDLTLEETVAELRKQRIRASRSALWRFLDRHNITLKKKPCKLPNGSEQMWRAHVGVGYESKVFLIPPGWCLSTRLRSARTWRD